MFRWADHTGELELEIEAPDEATVFQDAAAALHELMDDRPHRSDEKLGDARELEVVAPDRATLLAEYLTELLFLAETEGFVPVRLGRLELAEGGLSATVEGYRGRPSPLVKAATYHRLAFERRGARWHARVVLDV
jgi:SHS2 domain-containing protein